MKSSHGKTTVQGEDAYAFDHDDYAHDQGFAESGKFRKTPRAAGSRMHQGAMDESGDRGHAKGQARSGLGDESEPGPKKPEKRAPANQPPGRKPAPEKFPGR